MSTEFVQVTEIKVGDRIFFPNSRHPQTVEEITAFERSPLAPTSSAGGLAVVSGSSTWLLPENEMVKRYTEDG